MIQDQKNINNMRQLLELLEQRLAGRDLFRYMCDLEVKTVSAESFFAQIRDRAAALEAGGLVGRHIGIMGSNSYLWLVHLCAVFWTGSVAVLVDRDTDAETLAELAARVDMTALLYDETAGATVSAAALPEGTVALPMASGPEAGLTSGLEPGLNPGLKPAAAEPWTTDMAAAMCQPDDLACIFFTSGTTAKCKAVMMSQRGLLASICHHLIDKPFHALLGIMPFHHLAGFATVLNTLYLGAQVCIAEDVKYFYRYLEYMKPDYVSIVPSMMRMLARKLKKGGAHGCLLGWDLHIINCGGAAFSAEFLQMLLDRDIIVLQGYGASEAGAIGFLWEMSPERPDTIGKAPAELEVKIMEGELHLRSASLMMGYYGDEAATREVMRDGWYATGDLCRQDGEGYLYLTGRKKNLIILSNGENVSPEEIETKLYACAAIREVMVGAADEMVTAFVWTGIPKDGMEEEQQAARSAVEAWIEQYNETAPIYKQVRRIIFTEKPFEKTAIGKLVRRLPDGESAV